MSTPPTSPTRPPHTLLQHPDLWRAGQLDAACPSQPTGFAVLDAHLPGGGWPLGGLTELLLAQAGIGELQLLAPALARLSTRQRWIIWINPPFVPYAPALAAHGIDTSKILLVHTTRRGASSAAAPHTPSGQAEPPGKRAAREALWALERASRSGTCSAALAWLDERYLRPQDTQRLQLAAAQGKTLTCLFRPAEARQKASMAPLRLHLQAPPPDRHEQHAHRLTVHIAKRRGGWAVPDLQVELQPQVARPSPESVQAQLSLWRSERQQQGTGQLPLWPVPETSELPREQVH